jgi:hypothetical protein
MLNQPELKLAWQVGGGRTCDSFVLGIAEHARDGWVPIANAVAYSNVGDTSRTVTHVTGYQYPGLVIPPWTNRFTNIATVYSSGAMTCDVTQQPGLGFPGWTWSAMCWNPFGGKIRDDNPPNP